MTPLPTIIAELEEAERAGQNSFLVIHEGDGRHATVCFTHKQAADAAILGMWADTVESTLNEDEWLRDMHAEISDPQSDQWKEGDGKRIHYDFEDGSLLIIQIPVSVTHLPTLREAVKRQGEALEPFAAIGKHLRKTKSGNWHYISERGSQYSVGSVSEVSNDDLMTAYAALKETTDV